MNSSDLSESKIKQQVEKYENSERKTSQPKYSQNSQNLKYEAGSYGNSKNQVLKNSNSRSSEKKVLKVNLVNEASKEIENCSKEAQASEQISELPLQIVPQPISKPQIPNAKDTEYEVEARAGDMNTPDKSEKARTVDNFNNDNYSNLGISTPGAYKDQYPIEDDKHEDNRQTVDIDILKKEYELGCELLNKASEKIDKKTYQSLLYNSRMNVNDYLILQIMLSLLFSIKHNKDVLIETVESTNHYLRNYDDIVELQNNFDRLIQMPKFNGATTLKFRDVFVRCSNYESNMESISAIKEYL